jgi:hypothetical protein
MIQLFITKSFICPDNERKVYCINIYKSKIK